jgi:hypothetical protein
MKLHWVLALAACLLPFASRAEASAPRTHTVLVELFTSQGCSACPPADSLLEVLAASREYHDRIVPLVYHVDYWDRLGWTDPLGSADWSNRQRAYAKRLSPTKLYTPELVVDGTGECVGFDESAAQGLIDQALDTEPGGEARITGLTVEGDSIRVGVKAETRAAGDDTLDVMVAVFESGIATEVKAGENEGRTLSDAFAVRALKRAFTLPAKAPRRGSAVVAVPLGPGWNPAHLGAAVFIQDRRTLAVTGAAVSPAAD